MAVLIGHIEIAIYIEGNAARKSKMRIKSRAIDSAYVSGACKGAYQACGCNFSDSKVKLIGHIHITSYIANEAGGRIKASSGAKAVCISSYA